jgi:hypothetical protein
MHRDRAVLDPGTIVECDDLGKLYYRRLGDDRLTFLQFDVPPLNKVRPFSDSNIQATKFGLENYIRQQWLHLTEKVSRFVCGYVIVL